MTLIKKIKEVATKFSTRERPQFSHIVATQDAWDRVKLLVDFDTTDGSSFAKAVLNIVASSSQAHIEAFDISVKTKEPVLILLLSATDKLLAKILDPQKLAELINAEPDT
jgi:hypothetical protein